MEPKARNSNETGLLEYLEDIIGSNRYVEKIEMLDRVLEESDERRIEQTNRVKASNHELKGLEHECQVAIDWITKERELLKLQTYKFFVDLGRGVSDYNTAIQLITSKRDELKDARSKRKEMYEKNSTLVTEITSLHTQQETAERRHKELQADFQLLERTDIMIANSKKH